ncbi:amidohydrolase [Polynucleobacter sp. es-EL-1]|uniref:amidohydrolase n=1 Tax=Polynucleobacter sp. es-EL-1 TaxID=1855652 RepID=UPI001BFDAF10|nr:amidohydrolase [Polynucleobacter sp. es-EL-1]QWE11356.1 amidohydrolase [Polynucleobacter sp. es-EL-1]
MSRTSLLKALPFFSLCFLSHLAAAEVQILKASTIITMDEKNPRAEAIAFDTTTKKIIAVGSLKDVQASAPKATVKDLGSTVLMPGFIDPHNHPILSGITTQAPAYWIAPYVGAKSWSDVQAIIKKADAEAPAGRPLVFNGLDRLLQQAPLPTRDVLDKLTPSGRAIIVVDNSGHAVYFNTATIKILGWKNQKPPVNPVGGSYGRYKDGTSNGIANESAALMAVIGPILPKAVPHILLSSAKWYAYMASMGITSTSEHTYNTGMYKGYQALASVPDTPLRMHVYHMAIEPDAGAQVTWSDPSLVRKNGIKLWADGSPWLGTVAQSFPYLENARTKQAEIIIGPLGEKGMNYTRLQLDQMLDKYAPMGYQMAFHCNGDVGFDVVLDAYENALNKYKLTGTDHRWRVEHLGAARADQFQRAERLGVTVSLAPFQYIYWGDLLDGTMFAPEYGSQWQRAGDGVKMKTRTTFHNDGSVSPPDTLRNIQHMVTRTTDSGKVHGANQAVTLDQALKASTINGAYQLKRDKEIGSLEVGKYADLVELSADITAVKPNEIVEKVKVKGTWLGGKKIDTKKFLEQITAIDPTQHQGMADSALKNAHSH